MEFKEIKRLMDLCNYEDDLYIAGYERIAGVDEVGRGSLAGPLVAVAVILDKKKLIIEDINDSKKLTADKRKYIFKKVIRSCLCWSIAKIPPDEIDKLSITKANALAFKKAIGALKIKPDIILSDYISTDLGIKYLPIVNGDGLSVSVAAASIIAKVIRDQIMFKFSRYYPEYGFEHNKGYGTRKHLKSLQKYGPTFIHRVSFRGVLS
ncbi:MAG TPA: ribonuclease HII [Candidatus Hydromicrobium sp.]